MSQADFGNLESPLSGTSFINTYLEPWRDAVHTSHSGNSRPSYVQAGMIWLNTTAAQWVLNIATATDDIALGTVDPTSLWFTPAGVTRWGGNAGGTGNALTLTPTIPMVAWTTGDAYEFLVTAENTSELATINISGKGTKNLKCSTGGGKVNMPKYALQSGMIARIVYDGTDAILINLRPHNLSASIATASTINLNNASGDYIHLTGTTTVNTIQIGKGQEKTCICDGIFTINDTSGSSPQVIVLPGRQDIVTAAGDVFVVRGEEGSVARIIAYHRADGTPIAGGETITVTTMVAASGTSMDFTGFPSDTKQIRLSASDLSTNGTDEIIIQLIDSGGVETTVYKGNCQALGVSGLEFSSGFKLVHATAAAGTYHGGIVLDLMDLATNLWEEKSIMSRSDSATNGVHYGSGSKALSAALTGIRLTTSGGSNTFDGGNVTVSYIAG